MLVDVGTVLKPRGLQGEIKVGITYNHSEIFNCLNQVTLKGKVYHVERGSVQNGFAYLRLAGIDSIEKAEQLRNQKVMVEESDLQLQDNEILSSELIGYEVIHNGKIVGEVVAVENYGAGDFFEIAITGKEFVLIPNEDEFIVETNIKTRTLVLAQNALDAELV